MTPPKLRRRTVCNREEDFRQMRLCNREAVTINRKCEADKVRLEDNTIDCPQAVYTSKTVAYTMAIGIVEGTGPDSRQRAKTSDHKRRSESDQTSQYVGAPTCRPSSWKSIHEETVRNRALVTPVRTECVATQWDSNYNRPNEYAA